MKWAFVRIISQVHPMAKKVKHLEDKSTDDVDVVIQHVLPHQFEFKGGVKNIGLFDWETTNFLRSNWSHCCNMLDEIWVPSIQNVAAVKKSGVSLPVKILPCSCDTERFDKEYESLKIPRTDGKCVFYTIGEMTRRKNIIAIIRAFYSAFSVRDDVVLVIKTNLPGKTSEEATNILKSTIDDIKKSMHIYMRHNYYPPVICITNPVSEQQICELHRTGDVFVSASHGEAWGIPAHDAMGFGNPAILSAWGAYPELMLKDAEDYWQEDIQLFHGYPRDTKIGWLINGQLTPCFGQVDTFPDLYTGQEMWYEPNIGTLVSHMQEAYEEWASGKLQRRGNLAKQRAKEFSYEKIGMIAKKNLESEN